MKLDEIMLTGGICVYRDCILDAGGDDFDSHLWCGFNYYYVIEIRLWKLHVLKDKPVKYSL